MLGLKLTLIMRPAFIKKMVHNKINKYGMSTIFLYTNEQKSTTQADQPNVGHVGLKLPIYQ